MGEVERLRAALRAIVEFRPETEELPEGWNEGCKGCEKASTLRHLAIPFCSKHRQVLKQRDRLNQHHRNCQDVGMRQIALEALEERWLNKIA